MRSRCSMKWTLLVTLSCLRLGIMENELAKQKKSEMDSGAIYRV